MRKILFKNARIITPTGITPGELLTVGDRIGKIVFDGRIDDAADETTDVRGNYLSPGFIDIHTHGAGGSDFMDGTLEDIYQACRMHLAHGTTSILPTTLASTRESLMSCLELFNQVEMKKRGLSTILGLHLEGPYFSYEQRGAQSPEHLRNPDREEYLEALKRTDRIKRWSFAVELDGADEFLNVLKEHKIVSSLAHSDADCGQVMRAYENGMTALTHFYSAMTGVRRVNAYRAAGAVEAGYLLDDLYVEVIADGRHLPKELLQLIYKVKGADRICLVTDSMRAAGMPDGESVLGSRNGGMKVIVEDGVAKLCDRSAFAGSVATADRLVRTMYRLTDAPLHEVVKMMTLTPAKLMKIDAQTGSIAVGKMADLVVFDEEIRIEKVMTRGNWILE
ncbi:N-acetylglucosamine-6-phosphate deacetylase [Clostridium sp. MCC353]|uniref:N-acetylglucosamine-6-phosphate deacetylase n=1 Tax=Clostridium sp. MCC353 TaxID=2592646 RepID=UPI001C020408|nr:N-acetylglucosamine-6-phosphate deacetylase [Clostridium sp. MCC353]MBT9775344.1 N-acetylglucosamine-6-phosphate deacetylase [Clostridium sp. MCC353]